MSRWMHHFLGDQALVAQLEHRAAFGVEQLAPQALVGLRTLLLAVDGA